MKRFWLISLIVACTLAIVVGALYIFNRSGPEQRCNDIRKRAFLAQQAGDLPAAEKLCQSALVEARQSDNALQCPLVLNELVQIYAAQHNYDAQERTLREILHIYDRLRADKLKQADSRSAVNHGYLDAVTKLAQLLQSRGQNEQALPLYKVALDSSVQDLGTLEDQSQLKSEYASLLKKLGKTSESQEIEGDLILNNEGYDWKAFQLDAVNLCLAGQWAQAEPKLVIFKKRALLTHDPAALAKAEVSLGQCYLISGRTAQSEAAYREAAAVRIQKPRYISLYQTQLACALQHNGKIAEASDCFKRAFTADPDFIVPASNQIFRAYIISGKFANALSLSKWLLQQMQATPGIPTYAIASEYCRISEAYFNLREPVKANEYANKALALNAFPSTSADYAQLMLNMGCALDRQNRFKEGEIFWRKFLTLKAAKTIPQFYLAGLAGLCDDLCGQKRYREAQGIVQQRLAYSRKHFAPYDRPVVDSLASYAAYWEKAGNESQSESYWRQAVDTMLKSPQKDPATCDTLYFRLADCQTHQNKLKQSVSTLLEKLDYCKKNFGEVSINTVSTILELGDLTRYQGGTAEANRLYRLAVSICENHNLTKTTEYAKALFLLGTYSKSATEKAACAVKSRRLAAQATAAPQDPALKKSKTDGVPPTPR